MLYKNVDKNRYEGTILSTQFPKVGLNINGETKYSNDKNLNLRKKILIYIIENKYFIEHSVAYALGFVNVRSIMLDNPKLVELSFDKHNVLKQKKDIDIEYKVVNNRKENIQIFIDNSGHSISYGAAYFIGLIDDKTFYENPSDTLFYINDDLESQFREKYNVEYVYVDLVNKNVK